MGLTSFTRAPACSEDVSLEEVGLLLDHAEASSTEEDIEVIGAATATHKEPTAFVPFTAA